jgi:hypothetical protein
VSCGAGWTRHRDGQPQSHGQVRAGTAGGPSFGDQRVDHTALSHNGHFVTGSTTESCEFSDRTEYLVAETGTSSAR